MKPRHYLLPLILITLSVLTACAPGAGEGAPLDTVAPPVPTEIAAQTVVAPTLGPAEPAATPTIAPQPSQTSAPPLPMATAAPTDAANGDAPPASGDPVVVTGDFTNVRRGPGLSYEVSHVLSPGTTAPIQGRDNGGAWWAVPGPGEGPGPVGWVSDAVVTVQGDLSGVTVLLAPPIDPDLPIVGNDGAPPGGDTCVVVHPGPGDTGPVFLRDAPSNDAQPVAILGLDRWADIVEPQSGWYRVRDANAGGGWVHQSAVTFAGRCSGPGSGPDLPVVDDPGSPPSDTCVAVRPGQFPPPGIHLGPGRQFALVARLGNWAEVLSTEVGWHQILLGPGEVGWISADDVDLIGPCAAPN